MWSSKVGVESSVPLYIRRDVDHTAVLIAALDIDKGEVSLAVSLLYINTGMDVVE